MKGESLFSHRPTVAEIDLDALAFNYRQLRKKIAKTAKILAVVKADAYGHGACFVAKELESLGVDLFGVAICEEGIALRDAGIRIPIIVLNGIFRGQIGDIIKYDLTPVIYDLETAQKLSSEFEKTGRKVKTHIKIDTGMGRIGIRPDDIKPFFLQLKEMKGIEIEGIMSHLSRADGNAREDQEYTATQLRKFQECIEEIALIGFSCPLRHIANSAATVDLPLSLCNLVRPGLMLYGAYPSPLFVQKVRLKPVMSFTTEIMQLKKVSKGECISYGGRFVTKRQSLIATLPVGYADGYNRLLSNRGEVLVREKKAQVVGTVCMDMIMADVTEVPDVCSGDKVVLIGRQGKHEVSDRDMAERIGTISYEIFCSVSKRVPRIYMKDGKIIGKTIDA